MRATIARIPLLACLVLVGGAPGRAAEGAGEAAAGPEWGDFRLGQYISRGRLAPADVLELDNNGEILLACRDGCSMDTLEAAGIPVLESQLVLLRSWALLRETADGKLRAAIPILEGTAAERLENRVSELAGGLAVELAGDVAALTAALEERGWKDHAFAVLYSYVLDGEVWSFFEEYGMVPSRGRPLSGVPWSGVVWAYRPSGGLEPQTGTVRRQATTLRIISTEGLEPLLEPLLSGPLSLRTLFSKRVDQGATEDPELRQKLERYGVLRSGGGFAVAVIEEAPEDPLYARCAALTERIVDAIRERVDLPNLAAELGLASSSQALVVAYHQLMWTLTERLVEAGALALPAALAEPAAATPADVGELIVLARRPGPTPAGDADTDEKR